jgi:hypothetical protein
MSGTIQQYWKDVRALELGLPEFVWLIATAAGARPFVTQVAAGGAAKLLHAKSHRIAAQEEVDAHHSNDAATLKQVKRERMRRSGAAVVVVDESTSEPTPRRRR